MYNVGDKIVYPMYGAGVIEAVEEKIILGKKQSYYIMRMPFGDMKVMIPMQNARDVGIRDIIAPEEATRVIDHFLEVETDCTSNWNKRYRENMLKIKSGDVYEVAGVVKSLICRDKERGLSTGERKMLSNAKQILMSELILCKSMAKADLEKIFDQVTPA